MATTSSIPATRTATIGLESAVVFCGWAFGTLAASLAAWVLIPTLMLGWRPLVVTSGSMEPSISAGDVVLVDPEFGTPGPGSVVAFESSDGVTIHRVARVEPDGSLTTRGDANAHSDSTPLRPDDLRGVGRLLVPHIGLVRTTNWIWLLALATLFATTAFVGRERRGPVLAVLLALALIGTSAAAAATFTTTTANGGSSASAMDLVAPTNVTASCGLIGAGNVNVDLTWSASPTAGIAGYRIYRDDPAPGTVFSSVGSVGSGTTSFTDSIATPITVLGTYTYVVRSHAGSWESEDSNTDAVSVTRPLLVYICSNL